MTDTLATVKPKRGKGRPPKADDPQAVAPTELAPSAPGVAEVEVGYLDADGKVSPPLPQQLAFHSSTAQSNLLVGGFGAGKTQTICVQAILEMLQFPGNRGILARAFLTEMKSTTLIEFEKLCPPALISSWNRQDSIITFVNGSSLFYTGIDSGFDKLKSFNAGFVCVDELSEISEEVYLMLLGRLRRRNASRKFYAASNAAGHDFMYRRFVNISTKDENTSAFIVRTTDNPHLPEDYVRSLQRVYPVEFVRRFVDCSFDEYEGLVYSEFTEQHNAEDSYIPHPDHDQITFVLDYGYRVPTAVGMFATDYDGVSHLYRLLYETQLLPKQIAEWITRQPEFKWKGVQFLADPSIKGTERDGRSLYDDLSDAGVDFDLANNNRPQGYSAVNQLLKDGLLIVSRSTCKPWFQEQVEYKWKDRRPNEEKSEEAVKRKDHVMDCTRYFANSIDIPARPSAPDPRIPAWWRQAQEAKQRSNRMVSGGLHGNDGETYGERFT
jgi:PBSX family phage terminase large subunit